MRRHHTLVSWSGNTDLLAMADALGEAGKELSVAGDELFRSCVEWFLDAAAASAHVGLRLPQDALNLCEHFCGGLKNAFAGSRLSNTQESSSFAHTSSPSRESSL